MAIRRLADNGVLEPNELSLLYDIFDQICAQSGTDRQSQAAEDMAANLITYYQRGLRGEALVRAVAPKQAPP